MCAELLAFLFAGMLFAPLSAYAAPPPDQSEETQENAPAVTDEDAAPDQTPAAPAKKKAEPEIPYNYVALRALNKVTAHAETLEGPVGGSLHFGNLEIVPLACWSAPADERPENAVLLDVREMKPDETPQRIFVGWMFSSSPSVSAMEHPVYDISALKCRYLPPKNEAPPKAQKPKPKKP